MGLRLENGDLVLEAIIDALLLLEVEGRVCRPRDLSMSEKVPVGWLLFRFSFSFIQDSRSSFHLRVTFISLRIEQALSALSACLATRIFPVMLFPSSSGLPLFSESDLPFCGKAC
jgi:hypothetical protein